jgi:tetratricopeptide (TPR) repeat protein
MDQGDTKAAFDTVKEVRKSFNNAPVAVFAATVMESLLHDKEGNAEASQRALAAAETVKAEHGLDLTEDQTLDFARACLANGEADKGSQLVEQIVRSNHESRALIAKATQIFEKTGHREQGETLIQHSVEGVIALNNEGLRKAQEGDLEKAVEMLDRAAAELPNNVQIALNAAHLLLVLVGRTEWNEDRMLRARSCLAQARSREPANPKLLKLTALFRQVSQKYGASGT